LNVSLPDVRKCSNWGADGVTFDAGLLLARLCGKSGSIGLDALTEAVDVARKDVPADVRDRAHGHDFMEAMRMIVVKVVKKNKLAEELALSRSLFLLLEFEACRGFQLFQEIDKRLSGSAET